MNLEEFHHAIRAARSVVEREGASGALVIMGSQSILAAFPASTLDRRLLMSAELDVMPVAADPVEVERLSDFLHGSLGQDSRFQEFHGVHVDGITIETSVLPSGWVHRLIPAVDPGSGATGWFLDPHDLAVAKLVAGRPKDVDFVRVLVENRLIDPEVVRESLGSVVDVRVGRAVELISAMAANGLAVSDRVAWHRRRRQALQDRLARTTEASPADVLEQLLDAHARP